MQDANGNLTDLIALVDKEKKPVNQSKRRGILKSREEKFPYYIVKKSRLRKSF